MSGKKGSFLDLLFLGGIIGAGLGLLFAPSKGEDTRKKIKEKIDELSASSSGASEGIKTVSQEMIQKTISSIEEGIDRLTLAAQEAQKASDEKRRELEEATPGKGGE